jgi:Holliday junction DNA helicase RuvA
LITKITGRLAGLADDQATLGIDAFEYQVLIPEFTRRQLQHRVGESVELHTVHYLEGNPAQGRVSPRLVGFLNEAEREFFELFCSVDGVGVKKALRAMVRPVQEIAALIEEQDAKGLSALPGVGPATADRIIAKLHRKMPKFALLRVGKEAREADVEHDVVQETYAALITLGHSESEARKLIDAALAEKKKYKDVNALLTAIYEKVRGT